jgi:hypothetical protein
MHSKLKSIHPFISITSVTAGSCLILSFLLSCETTPQDDNPPTADDTSGATPDETSDAAATDEPSADDAIDALDAVDTDTETATEEGDDNNPTNINTSFLARYEIKDMSELNEVVISPEGGIIYVAEADSPYYGFSITFNVYSFLEDAVVSITETDDLTLSEEHGVLYESISQYEIWGYTLDSYSYLNYGPAIRISADQTLIRSVQITLPFDNNLEDEEFGPTLIFVDKNSDSYTDIYIPTGLSDSIVEFDISILGTFQVGAYNIEWNYDEGDSDEVATDVDDDDDDLYEDCGRELLNSDDAATWDYSDFQCYFFAEYVKYNEWEDENDFVIVYSNGNPIGIASLYYCDSENCQVYDFNNLLWALNPQTGEFNFEAVEVDHYVYYGDYDCSGDLYLDAGYYRRLSDLSDIENYSAVLFYNDLYYLVGLENQQNDVRSYEIDGSCVNYPLYSTTSELNVGLQTTLEEAGFPSEGFDLPISIKDKYDEVYTFDY